MTAFRKRPDNYFRFNPPQGLGERDFADYMSEGTVVEITQCLVEAAGWKGLNLGRI
jgi:hypothetical protein